MKQPNMHYLAYTKQNISIPSHLERSNLHCLGKILCSIVDNYGA